MAEGRDPPPPLSYASTVSKSESAEEKSISFSSVQNKIPLSQFKGEPALFLTEEEEDELALSFQWTLIRKFSWGWPPMVQIRKEVVAAGFQGECKVGLLDNRHILFKFEKEADFQRFWTRKVWHFQGFQAKIFKWTKDFDPAVEPALAPVWIRFPLLPLHLHRKDNLYSLASVAGKPLKLDSATASASDLLRPSKARICVVMDLTKPSPSRIWIGSKEKGKWQHIEVEDRPDYCSKCQKLGHDINGCDPTKKRAKPSSATAHQSKAKQIAKAPTQEWIQVNRNQTKKPIGAPKVAFLDKGKEVDPSSLPISCPLTNVPSSSGPADLSLPLPASTTPALLASSQPGFTTTHNKFMALELLEGNEEVMIIPSADPSPMERQKSPGQGEISTKSQNDVLICQLMEEQVYCDEIIGFVTKILSSSDLQVPSPVLSKVSMLERNLVENMPEEPP